VDGFVDSKGRVSVVNPETNETFWVPKAQAQQAVDQGFHLETWDAYQQRQEAKFYDQPGSAVAAGMLRTVSLGLSDVAMEHLQPGRAAALKAHNPKASVAGEVAGMLLPTGPVGLAGKAGKALATRLAAKAVGGSRAAKIAAGAAKLAPGMAEGAAIGTTQAVSGIALESTEAQMQGAAHHLAEKAVVGALTGGLFSLVGLGLGGLGAKIAGRAQGPAGVRMQELNKASKALKHDAKALQGVTDRGLQEAVASAQLARAQAEAARIAGNEAAHATARANLAAAEARLVREGERLGFAGGRGTQSNVPLHELADRMGQVKQALSTAQAEAFGLGGLGQAIQRVGGPGGLLGGGLGFGAGGLLGGGVGWIVGQAALPYAGKALARVLANKTATRAIGTLMGGAGKVIRTGAVTALTRDEAQAVRERAADLDPAAVKQAAAQAYQAEGVTAEVGELLADFQGRRAAALQQAAATDRTPEALGRSLEAIRDPRGIMQRIARDEVTAEDLRVLETVSPGVARQLREAAREALEEDRAARKLSAERRRTLSGLARDASAAKAVLMMQRLYAAQRAGEEQRNRMIRGRVGMLPHGNQLKAIEAGGGPGLRR
jgi:hypothetical protein